MGEQVAKLHTCCSFEPFHAGQELINVPEVVVFDESRVVNQVDERRLHVGNIGYGCQSEVQICQVLHHLVVLDQRYVHHDRALTVAYVVWFLLGVFVDIGQVGR